jgi:hypothetical protein
MACMAVAVAVVVIVVVVTAPAVVVMVGSCIQANIHDKATTVLCHQAHDGRHWQRSLAATATTSPPTHLLADQVCVVAAVDEVILERVCHILRETRAWLDSRVRRQRENELQQFNVKTLTQRPEAYL